MRVEETGPGESGIYSTYSDFLAGPIAREKEVDPRDVTVTVVETAEGLRDVTRMLTSQINAERGLFAFGHLVSEMEADRIEIPIFGSYKNTMVPGRLQPGRMYKVAILTPSLVWVTAGRKPMPVPPVLRQQLTSLVGQF